MAGLQASGLGSGLDINSLVSQLVAAERLPHQTLITRRESKATLELSALSQLKGALSTFKNALDPLKTEGSFSPRAATSGDTKIFTATATGSAAVGNYSIEVVSLAQAHQLATDAYVGGSSAEIGTGTLSITFGGSTFEVEIDEDHKTLAGIRDAINKAPGNTGVQATLLNEANGTRLVLTSSKTGAAHTIHITATGEGPLLQMVNATSMSVVQAAQDAHIRIGTFDHYSATNTIDKAIDGVSLTLLAESEEPVSLKVTQDTSLLKQRINSFVNAFNSLHATFGKLRGYDAATKTAGPLLGDALVRSIEARISTDLVTPVSGISGAYTSLASIGITKQADGTLKLDETKLNEALTENASAVARIFGSEDGVAARLSSHIEAELETGAALDTRNQAIQKTIETLNREKEALDARMQTVENRYRAQFTQLDILLSRLQTTSSYLGTQLESLHKLANRDY